MHATDLQRLTDDCDTLLEAAASARQHTTMMRPSERKTGELDISVSSFGAREPEDAEGGSAAARADGEVEAHTPAAATCGREAGAAAAAVSVAGVGEEAPDTALAAARLRGVGDWQLLEHEVARALHGLLPAAEGPPAKVGDCFCTLNISQLPHLGKVQIFFPIEVHTRGSHLPLTA